MVVGARVQGRAERARTDLVEAGRVEADGLRLHDGTTAGTGDLVVTRLNDRRLSTGRGWVKNGDRWHVTHRYDDGSLAVRRLGSGDQPHGKALVLPAKYVREEVELSYASTVHRAQGASVDTAHALVDPEASSRELFYVAMTRGKHRNHAYVIVPDPHEIEPHLDQPEPLTLTDRLDRARGCQGHDRRPSRRVSRRTDSVGPRQARCPADHCGSAPRATAGGQSIPSALALLGEPTELAASLSCVATPSCGALRTAS